MEEAQSFQQVVLEQLNILKCEAHPKPHVLFRSEWNRDSKWIRDLNMECKTIKHLKQKQRGISLGGRPGQNSWT